MGEPLFSIYRDAAQARPHGARWKAMHVSEPGSLIGLPVSVPGDHRVEMEWPTMREAIAWIIRTHGATRRDMSRVFLPRYEGLEGYYGLAARA